MDKQTLSHYGWIVILVLVLSVFLAMATPFGRYIGKGVSNLAISLVGANDNAVDSDNIDQMGDYWENYLNGVPNAEDLQSKYQFKYYSTIHGAINDVNNGTIGTNVDATEENAVAGIYIDENSVINVVILKDSTINGKIKIQKDMILNLGGKTTTVENDYMGILTDGTGISVTIDGQMKGSTFIVNGNDGGAVGIGIKAKTKIIGGTYIINDTIKDNKYDTMGIQIQPNMELEARDCTIIAKSLERCQAIYNKGTTRLYNCNVSALTDVRLSPAEGELPSVGDGVYNIKNMEIYNCNITGTQAAIINNSGTLYVNGGEYKGCFTPIILGGSDKELYIENATIKTIDMIDGYTTDSEEDMALIGISLQKSQYPAINLHIYFNNCKISASNTLYMPSGATNNNVYMSDTTISNCEEIPFSIYESNHIHIGIGNNFSVNDVNDSTKVTTTNAIYKKQ